MQASRAVTGGGGRLDVRAGVTYRFPSVAGA